MRTGIFAFIASKKQKVNDSAPSSFGKTVLEAVKNSKGTTEEELAGEMKGVLDSMAILKDCDAKNKLMDAVKDCFDNKKMATENEDELVATLDAMWIDIHGDSLKEMAKAFAKLSEPAPSKEGATTDSKDEEEENKDSKDEEEEENKDSKDEEENKDSKDEEENKDSKDEKDGCNKDSAMVASIVDSIKKELAPMITDTVKEVLGVKGGKAEAEGIAMDSENTGSGVAFRDYSSFLDK